MIVITQGERIVNGTWWVITTAITSYLFYGVYNTVEVILRWR